MATIQHLGYYECAGCSWGTCRGHSMVLTYQTTSEVYTITRECEPGVDFSRDEAKALIGLLRKVAGERIDSAQLVPPGYVLVPREPTEALRAVLTDMLTNCRTVEESYQDLLAARPELP